MLFHFWKYINQNQAFILDSHQPFICSAETIRLRIGLYSFLYGNSKEFYILLEFLDGHCQKYSLHVLMCWTNNVLELEVYSVVLMYQIKTAFIDFIQINRIQLFRSEVRMRIKHSRELFKLIVRKIGWTRSPYWHAGDFWLRFLEIRRLL